LHILQSFPWRYPAVLIDHPAALGKLRAGKQVVAIIL